MYAALVVSQGHLVRKNRCGQASTSLMQTEIGSHLVLVCTPASCRSRPIHVLCVPFAIIFNLNKVIASCSTVVNGGKAPLDGRRHASHPTHRTRFPSCVKRVFVASILVQHSMHSPACAP